MLRTLLREGTRVQHARAEAALPLLDPMLTRERYVRCLAALHALQAPLERRLAACADWSELGIAAAERWRAARIVDDLRALGASPLPAVASGADLPDLATRGRALGARYVLEGATLGGRVVARHLATTLALTPTRGASFFAGHGERTGAMWREFERALDHAALGWCEPADVLAGARDTFDAFTRWLGAASRAPLASVA